MEPLLTTEEVAEFFKVDVVTVRRLISRGELPAYRIGSEFRVTRADLDSYLKMQRVAGSKPAGTAGDELEVYTMSQMAGKSFTARDLNRFDKFTERMRKVFTFAQQEAIELRHNYIGTEHLLLGLVREGEGVAATVLAYLGVELNKVRERVVGIIGEANQELPIAGEVGLTPRSKKAVELAVKEAQLLGHHYIGTEHMLLGLIREGEGIAAKVLTDMGIQLERVRIETLRVLSEIQAQETTPPDVPQEAGGLLTEGQESKTCQRCQAQNPEYFHYCFNCGARII